MEAGSARARAYADAFRRRATRYDNAVHGAFNHTDGRPFYDDAHEPHIWDTSYDTSGDGAPDVFGAYAYDTAWIFAHAIANVTARGGSARDGAALREALLAVAVDGVTGPIAFDGLSQDRLQSYDLVNLAHDGDNALAASTPLTLNVIAPDGFHTIDWAAGFRIDDGSAVASSQSYVLWPATLREGGFRKGSTALVVTELRDAFGERPLNASAAAVSLRIVGGTGRASLVAADDVDESVSEVPPPPPPTAPPGASPSSSSPSLAAATVSAAAAEATAASHRRHAVRFEAVGSVQLELWLQATPSSPPTLLSDTTLTVAPTPLSITFIILISVGIALLAILISILVVYVRYRASRERERRYVIRLRSTGLPPQLVLPPSIKWHLFLSHTWGSGQDRACSTPDAP